MIRRSVGLAVTNRAGLAARWVSEGPEAVLAGVVAAGVGGTGAGGADAVDAAGGATLRDRVSGGMAGLIALTWELEARTSGGDGGFPRPLIDGAGGKFVGIDAMLAGLADGLAFAAPTDDATVGATENCAELRSESVNGKEVLHCGHAATFPINSSGATSSFPHFGQRTVMDIKCKLRNGESRTENEKPLHLHAKEEVI